jgi:hypothetical protein
VAEVRSILLTTFVISASKLISPDPKEAAIEAQRRQTAEQQAKHEQSAESTFMNRTNRHMRGARSEWLTRIV